MGREADGYRIVAVLASHTTAKDLSGLQEKVSRRFKHLPHCVVLESRDGKGTAVLPGKQRGKLLSRRIARLKATGLFAVVEPDWVVKVQATPSDAAFADGRLWGLHNTGQSGGTPDADIDAPAAWDVTTGNAGVVVGVVDTGIRYTHQDLAANMWVNPTEIAGNGIDDDLNGFVDDVHGINAITSSGDPMDDNGHGSHCAGTIGAAANGSGPHVGVAWQVRLMALKFLASDGSGYSSDAITCIDYAIGKGVDILSNSWGGGGYSLAMAAAIHRAQATGILFVAAAGNEGNDNDATPSYPASYTMNNVIAVAALDRSDQLAYFSNYGATSVDLGAPGVDIFSCTAASDTSYGTYNGTSMAAPHVSGVAALIKAQFPGITLDNLRQRLLSSTVVVGALSGRCTTAGRVNAAAALLAAADGILEVGVTSANNPVIADQTNAFFVQVSDLTPVTGASVSGRFEGQVPVAFLDNGITPDATAADGTYSADLLAPSASGPANVIVDVVAAGKTPASVTNVFSIVGRPDNDDFSERESIAAGVTTVTGGNRNATLEAGEPVYASGSGSQTVWWQWTAPETRTVAITTFDSSFDTILSVFTGSSLGSLTLVGVNDDTGGLQSSVQFTMQAGVTYLIQVNGYGDAVGDIRLNLPAAAGAPAITDEPDDTTVLLGSPFTLEVSATGMFPLQYQWYQDGVPVVGATAATYHKAASVLADGGLYTVAVSNAVGSTLSRQTLVSVEQVDLQPDNDAFIDSNVLGGNAGRIITQNTLATGEPGEPNHAGVATPLASIWFSWTAPADGRFSVNTFGSDFDTVLAAYEGSAVGSLSQVAANDDSQGLQSALDFDVSYGVTYHIAVDGYATAVGAVALDYQAALSAPPVILELDDTTQNFSSAGGMHTVDVSANVSWTASSSQPWVQITSGTSGDMDGTITYLVPVYAGSTVRAATITVSGGGLSRSHTVRQASPLYRAVNDLDGDGVSDYGCYDASGIPGIVSPGQWYFMQSRDGFDGASFGYAGTVAVVGDFDGDGLSDYGCYDAAGIPGVVTPGQWYFMKSSAGFDDSVSFGYAGTVPVVGDFDGDGTYDYGCYDEAGIPGLVTPGSWYFMKSTDGFQTASCGYEGTVAVVGEFDGDGSDDFGCYDADGLAGLVNPGQWYFMKSTEGFDDSVRFGYAGTVPVVGDFDGDGTDDYGCYDANGISGLVLPGQWYFMKSSDGFDNSNSFGYPGTVPVIGDYDGDGADDFGCYDAIGIPGLASPGSWYFMKTTDGFSSTVFGYSGTVPVGGLTVE